MQHLLLLATALLLVQLPRCCTDTMSLSLTPARTERPLRSVSPHFISFALDNAFIRDPTGISGVVLPQDGTNSTRIDFQDPLLNKVMPLVGGGYIRIGGTYTDFVHYYVPGANFTQCPYKKGEFHCPGNSVPCCLPLTMQRWTEALDAAHRWGMRVVFNLNILHGRFEDYSARGGASPGPPPPPPGKPPPPLRLCRKRRPPMITMGKARLARTPAIAPPADGSGGAWTANTTFLLVRSLIKLADSPGRSRLS